MWYQRFLHWCWSDRFYILNKVNFYFFLIYILKYSCWIIISLSIWGESCVRDLLMLLYVLGVVIGCSMSTNHQTFNVMILLNSPPPMNAYFDYKIPTKYHHFADVSLLLGNVIFGYISVLFWCLPWPSFFPARLAAVLKSHKK